jgi:hypothetical protein
MMHRDDLLALAHSVATASPTEAAYLTHANLHALADEVVRRHQQDTEGLPEGATYSVGEALEHRVVALTMGRTVTLGVLVACPPGTSIIRSAQLAWDAFYTALEQAIDPGDSHGPLVAAQRQLLRVSDEYRAEREAREDAEQRAAGLERTNGALSEQITRMQAVLDSQREQLAAYGRA